MIMSQEYVTLIFIDWSERIGNKIKEVRKKKGLSQREFGELIGDANKSLVSRWENGILLPNNSRQKLIAEIANVDISDFFEEKNNESSINANDIKIYLNQFEERWNEIIDDQSDRAEDSFVKLANEVDTQEMKYKLITEIISLPEIIEVDYDGTEFIGDSEEFKKEFISSKIDQIIYKKLNALKQSIPKNDSGVLHQVKQDIIKVEEKLKSYYLDTPDNKVINESLDLEVYYEISNVLKDTIFNLVRLEEYS